MLRRIIANPRLFNPAVSYRAYSSAGYGNATTTAHKNAEEPPLDIEDPQELHSTPPQHHNNNDAQHQQASTKASAYEKPKTQEELARDEGVKKQRKGMKRGDKEAMREFSSGCD